MTNQTTADTADTASGLVTEHATVPLDDLGTYHRNPRRGNVAAIAASLERLGQYRPIVVNRGTHTGRPNEVLAGNHTLLAARQLGWPTVNAVFVDVDDDTAARIVAADNRTADLGTYDQADLLALLSSLPDLDGTGYSDDDLRTLLNDVDPAGDAAAVSGGRGGPSLVDRFLIPPFTVLDARQGYWRERKQTWLQLGIRSEEGRAGRLLYEPDTTADPDHYRHADRDENGDESTSRRGLAYKAASADPGYYEAKRRVEAKLGRELSNADFEADHYRPEGGHNTGTSVFDPVLCELVYRWFCPPQGRVLDPFAGGSVRGIVAALLDRTYVGVELRGEQVEANRDQAVDIIPAGPHPEWHTGDSRAVLTADDAPIGDGFDLVFSCPPYADLERYSDDPADLSAMDYDAFVDAYRGIIAASLTRLADDRFAVIVVGEVRDKRGNYRGLVPDTIAAFTDAGAAFYNDAVLVTSVGSLPVRVGRQFETARKLGKTHQNVLVFVKGDAKAATEACGPVDVADPADAFGEVIE